MRPALLASCVVFVSCGGAAATPESTVRALAASALSCEDVEVHTMLVEHRAEYLATGCGHGARYRCDDDGCITSTGAFECLVPDDTPGHRDQLSEGATTFDFDDVCEEPRTYYLR